MTHRSALRRATTLAIPFVSAMALVACGGGGSSTTTSTTSPTTSVSAGVQNLTVTSAVRSLLVAAGAKSHDLPASDYVGLVAGQTYYAYDPADTLFWAGAALNPSRSSQAAEIASQDDGGYDLFTATSAAGPWTAYSDGLGTTPHATCSIVTPVAVRAVWGWSLTTPCGGPR